MEKAREFEGLIKAISGFAIYDKSSLIHYHFLAIKRLSALLHKEDRALQLLGSQLKTRLPTHQLATLSLQTSITTSTNQLHGDQEDEERQVAEAIRLSLLDSGASPLEGEPSSSRNPQRRAKKRKMDVIEIVSDDEDDGIQDGLNATCWAPKMERERLARLAKLKRSPPDYEAILKEVPQKTSGPVEARQSPFSREGFILGKASTSEPPRFSAGNIKQTHTHGSRQSGNDSDSSNAPPKYLKYPNGVVKRTWADGYPKTDTDIAFEEVLQKETLCVAVLSAFQWDLDWVLQKLPLNTIQKLVMVMHAKEEQDRNYRFQELSDLPRTTLVLPPMKGQVNCMHSKLMLLFHKSDKGQKWLRIAIPSANLTSYDWGELGGIMENTVFIIDLPQLPKANHNQSHFAKELHHFCTAQGMPEDLLNGLYQYDFSKTKDKAFVHSIGGSNAGEDWCRTGYSGLGTAVKALGLSSGPGLEFDFVTSSLGAANMEFISNMYRAALGDNGLKELQRRSNTSSKKAKKRVVVVDDGITDDDSETEFDEEFNQERIMNHVRVYFPSYETVRLSKKGFNSGGTICFQSSWWDSPTFPKSVMRDCVSVRDGLLMHNKMLFARPSRQLQASAGRVNAWAYVGSANMSESAWGKLVTDKSTKTPKMNCKNWECGVLFPVVAKDGGRTLSGTSPPESKRKVAEGMEVFGGTIPVPMKVPAESMEDKRPWFFRELR